MAKSAASKTQPTTDLPSLFGSEDPLFSSTLVAGVDEAGRGPLAGPVCAAAVILDPDRPVEGLNDSKKLSAARRSRRSFASARSPGASPGLTSTRSTR